MVARSRPTCHAGQGRRRSSVGSQWAPSAGGIYVPCLACRQIDSEKSGLAEPAYPEGVVSVWHFVAAARARESHCATAKAKANCNGTPITTMTTVR